jgi:hypothetical protein
MMKKILTIVSISAALALGACQKDYDKFYPDLVPAPRDTAWVSVITPSMPIVQLHDSLRPLPYRETINTLTGDTIELGNGTVLYFPENATGFAGAVVSPVVAEIHFVRQKGDMIRHLLSTVTKPFAGLYGLPLESGGMFNIVLKYNGQAVSLAPNKQVRMRWRDDNPSPAMKVFFMSPAPLGNAWLQTIDSIQNNVVNWINNQVQPVQKGYEMKVNQLNWINCDQFISNAGGATKVCSYLPVQYTNANTTVFMVFSDIRSAVQLYGDPASRTFCTGNLPVGRSAKIVSISKIGDKYFTGSKPVTISNNLTVQIIPEEKTLAQLNDFLNAL